MGQRRQSHITFGDVFDKAFKHLLPVLIHHHQPLLLYVADGTATGSNGVVHGKALFGGHCGQYFGPHPDTVVRLGDVVPRHGLVIDQIQRLVASEFVAALADKAHRPVPIG